MTGTAKQFKIKAERSLTIPNIYIKLKNFVETTFKTTLQIFLEALKLSPNAQGYVSGSITELLLKRELENQYGMEVKRIKEKWEGKKHSKHHGDFYFRKTNSSFWYVIESKGVKSNSEKWHKLYNYNNLKKFLIIHSDKISWIKQGQNIENQVVDWIDINLPKFKVEYSSNLYEFEEVQSYKSNRETRKFEDISKLKVYTRNQINCMIEKRLNYIMSKIKVLETHFVSGRSEVSERTQATPRKDEFNVIAIDIVLRFPAHKFLFANPKNLEPSADDPDHLQQNYIMGFIFSNDKDRPALAIIDEWVEDFQSVYDTLESKDSVNAQDMQIDNRYRGLDDEENDNEDKRKP